jgi:hypothetical protein
MQYGAAILSKEHSELVAQAKQVAVEEQMGVVALPSQGSDVVTGQSAFGVREHDPAA